MDSFEFENQSASSNFDLIGEINKYLKYWYLFVISVLLFFVAAKIYLRYTTPIYESHSEIKILDNSTLAFKLPDNMIPVFGSKSSKKSLDNEIEMIKSYQLMERVVKNLDLTTCYHRVGYFTTTELWKNQPFTIKWLKSSGQLGNKSLRFEIEIVEGGYEIVDDNEEAKLEVIGFNSVHINSGIPFKILPKSGLNLEPLIGKKFAFELLPLRQTALNLCNGVNVKTLANQSDILGAIRN